MKVVIIGGGIIGLCSAYYLQKNGWEATVIDRTDITDGCSYGNLGMIVPSHFTPLAAPGMLSQGIKWMFNRKSPFYVKPQLSASLISWGIKFARSANQQQVNRVSPTVLELNLYSKELYKQLAAEPGFDFDLGSKGLVMYYKTEKAGEEENHLARKATAMGLDVTVLDKKGAQNLEPQVLLDVLGAVHYKSDTHLSPNQLMPQLINHLKRSGVKFQLGDAVKKIIRKGKKIQKVITVNNEYEADIVVLAAGSWLPELAKLAGVNLSLMPGKGYSFNVIPGKQKITVPSILCEARVAITPMNGTVRYGGTMEIAPINQAINLTRVKGIVESIPKYFPALKMDMPEEKNIWFGFRPCTPDGLPYLGYAKSVDNLLIAGGHAMSGLSLGPASGKIIADLAEEKETGFDMSIFDPARFG